MGHPVFLFHVEEGVCVCACACNQADFDVLYQKEEPVTNKQTLKT